jgi:hypothetical protein
VPNQDELGHQLNQLLKECPRDISQPGLFRKHVFGVDKSRPLPIKMDLVNALLEMADQVHIATDDGEDTADGFVRVPKVLMEKLGEILDRFDVLPNPSESPNVILNAPDKAKHYLLAYLAADDRLLDTIYAERRDAYHHEEVPLTDYQRTVAFLDSLKIKYITTRYGTKVIKVEARGDRASVYYFFNADDSFRYIRAY